MAVIQNIILYKINLLSQNIYYAPTQHTFMWFIPTMEGTNWHCNWDTCTLVEMEAWHPPYGNLPEDFDIQK